MLKETKNIRNFDIICNRCRKICGYRYVTISETIHDTIDICPQCGREMFLNERLAAAKGAEV